jgi:elongation factor Ts
MSDYKPTTLEIKTLREKTLAGFQDCQKALVEAGGNMEAAEDIIRKKGLQVAAKKAHRQASDGLVVAKVSDDGLSGTLVEVNCETDFVAKTPQFQTLAYTLAEHAVVKAPDGITEGSALLDQVLHPAGGKTIKVIVDEVIGQIGENMCFSRTVRFQTAKPGVVHAYIHPPGKLGVLVDLGFQNEADKEKAGKLAHELALQIAFSDPSFICADDIPADVLDKERKIAMEKARDQGKPDHILPKIAEGMLRKYYQEECLLDQPLARDNKITVRDFVNQAGVAGATLRRFARFSLK